jgi:ATP synthase protein I
VIEQPQVPSNRPNTFSEQIGAKAVRKLKAQQKAARSVWVGFAVSGMIGWSITMPTLIGIALGVWLDKHHPGKQSWTLSLIVAGLVIGCWNAWRWIAQEEVDMRNDTEQQDD